MTASHADGATPPSDRFWDRIADRYARKPVADEAAYRTKLRVTRAHLRPDMEVLEIGCGTGSTALVHAPFVKHILAIDASSRMIEIARGKAEADHVTNVAFRRAAFDGFEAPDASFDAVLGLSVLHLLPDRRAAIAKVRRLLKPGGVFVSSTPCLGDHMRWFKPVGALGARLGLIPRVAVFTAAELEHDLVEQGFTIAHRWQPGDRRTLFLIATNTA